MQDYERTYAEFWAPILDAPGVDREDQIKRELHDYKFLMGEVPKVYEAVAGITKPNTMAFEVISQFESRYTANYIVRDDILGLIDKGADVAEIREYVESSYPDEV